MEFNFFWKFFNRFINLLMFHLIMNLYTFIHLYKNLEFSFILEIYSEFIGKFICNL